MSDCIVMSKATARRRLRPLLGAGPGQYVCHTCDNGACVNLEHVYLGDATTNNNDTVDRGRHHHQKRSECPKGHPLDGVKKGPKGKPTRYCLTCNRERVASWRRTK